MLPPGLLPDSAEPRRSGTSWVLGAAAFIALLSLAAAFLQIRRLTRERDEAVGQLVAHLKRAAPSTPQAKLVETPQSSVPEPPAASLPPQSDPVPAAVGRSPDVRIVPSRALDPQHLAQGLHEFHEGRYDQAERHFFRAFPDSVLYLALATLAEGRYAESIGFLYRAMMLDPDWLRRLKPSDLFGSPAAYRKVVRSLEEQLEQDPVNPDLKTLLAYLQYHDKGPAYAKALLIEATNARPEHEAARTFLEALGP